MSWIETRELNHLPSFSLVPARLHYYSLAHPFFSPSPISTQHHELTFIALTLNSPVFFHNHTESSTLLHCSPAYPNFSIIFHTHHASQPLTLLLQPPLFISSLARLTPCGRGVCNRPRGARRPPELRRRFESPSPDPPSRGPSPPESR